MIHLPVIVGVIVAAAVTELVKDLVDDAHDAGKQQLRGQTAAAGAR